MRNLKRGKRGQFYIIAAVIIIGALIGIAAFTNVSRKKADFTKIYDLGEELGIETNYVYDYGVYQDKNLNNLVENWTDIYLDYTTGQETIEDWIFVYGNEESITALTFTTITTGKVGIYAGGKSIEVPIEIKQKKKSFFEPEGAKVNVNVPPENLTYYFDLKKGENFFFIIRAEKHVSGS